MLKHYATLFLCIAVTLISKANSFPPDSTSSIVNRATSTVLIEDGKTKFGRGHIKQALFIFREAAVKDEFSAKANLWIAQCHLSLKNYGYAIQYGNKSLKLYGQEVNPELYYVLAVANHSEGNFNDATKYYQKTIEELGKQRQKTLTVNLKFKECKRADSLLRTDTKFKRVLLKGKINTGFNEYGALLCNGGKKIYFTGRRNDTHGGGINPDDESYYEDVYTGVWNDDLKQWDSITNEIERINTPGFEAFNYISEDGLTAIVTHNNTSISSKKETRSSDVCTVNYSKKGRWNTPKIIKNKSINSSFFDGAATLTADGNTMYFVSDRKGEKYGTDIYVATKKGKKWGDAKRLSDSINTNQNETTPFISATGEYLFFASKGHNGMGGYDIYVSKNLGNGEWTKAVNMGAGFNTVTDDTHFVYYPALNRAFISGVRIQRKKSSYDIFEIDMTGFKVPIK